VNSSVKTVAFWLVILLSGILLWKVVQAGGSGQRDSEIPFSKFMVDVNHGDVIKVTISGTDVRGMYKSGGAGFHTIVPANFPDMYKELNDKGVEVNLKDTTGTGWPTSLLSLSPIILFAALWFVMIRQMQFRSTKELSGTRLWHPATDAPPFSSIDQAGQSAIVQSPRLLLVNSAGDLALGYCKTHGGEVVFYPDAQIGPVVAWMLTPVPPANVVGSQKRS
jgi:hypothetical protein